MMRRTAKRALNTVLGKVGFEIRRAGRFSTLKEGFSHARVAPYASYAPWLDDASFQKFFGVLKSRTLVDEYRCFELWHLVSEVSKVPGDILEVGVWRGGTGLLMAKRCDLLDLDLTVHLCDTFAGVVKASDKDSLYKGGEHADTSVESVRGAASALTLGTPPEIHVGIFPDDTGAGLNQKVFRLCHIDVDVYESALDVFRWVWPKLSVGGIVVFDDYGFRGCEGISRLVRDQSDLPDRVVVQNLNGHALMIKTGAG